MLTIVQFHLKCSQEKILSKLLVVACEEIKLFTNWMIKYIESSKEKETIENKENQTTEIQKETTESQKKTTEIQKETTKIQTETTEIQKETTEEIETEIPASKITEV